MAVIPKNPKAPNAAKVEQRAEKFIRNSAQLEEEADQQPSISTTLRIPADLLKRIDAAAKKAYLTRSGWIKNKLSNLLDEEGN